MTTFCASDVKVVLRVRKKKQGPSVSIGDLEKALRLNIDNVAHFVQLDNDEGVSYLRFATCIFSRLVELKRPCLNVVVSRQAVYLEHDASQAALGSNPDTSEDDGMWSSIAADGYQFGDGSADFFDKYDVVAVGGTFDRLHAGHRLLLTAASWAARQKLLIGVTGKSLLQDKQHKELIASFEERSRSAMLYARHVKASLPVIDVIELHDPAGPTSSDPEIDALVVSSETAHGAKKINEVRAEAGLKPMSIIVVDVLDTAEQKLSSSILRQAEHAKGGSLDLESRLRR